MALSHNPDGLVTHGLNLFENEQYGSAREAFTDALGRDPARCGQRLRKHFLNSVQNRRYLEAQAIGVPLTQVFAEDAELANQMGHVNRHLGDLEKAADDYRRALKIRPGFTFARYNLAALAAGVDKFDDEAQKAVARFAGQKDFFLPKYQGNPFLIEEVRQNLARLKKSEKLEQMTRLIRKKALSPHGKDIEQAIELCHEADDLARGFPKISEDDVLESLRQRALSCLFLNKRSPTFRVLETNLTNLALYYMYQGSFEHALDAFANLQAKEGTYDYLDMSVVLCRAEAGQVKSAIKLLEKLTYKVPENRYYAANLALCYQREGDQDRAAKWLIKTASLLEATGGKFCFKEVEREADRQLKEENFTDALSSLQVILEHQPRAELLFKLGQAQLGLGHYALAQRSFVDCVEQTELDKAKLSQDIANLLANAGAIKKAEGRIQEAAECYDYASEHGNDPDHLNEAIKLARVLGNHQHASKLETRFNELVGQLKSQNAQGHYRQLMDQGKEQMKKKDYQSAIASFEQAMEFLPEKEVLMYLAKIYKTLNRPRALNRMLARWKYLSENRDQPAEEVA